MLLLFGSGIFIYKELKWTDLGALGSVRPLRAQAGDTDSAEICSCSKTSGLGLEESGLLCKVYWQQHKNTQ